MVCCPGVKSYAVQSYPRLTNRYDAADCQTVGASQVWRGGTAGRKCCWCKRVQSVVRTRTVNIGHIRDIYFNSSFYVNSLRPDTVFNKSDSASLDAHIPRERTSTTGGSLLLLFTKKQWLWRKHNKIIRQQIISKQVSDIVLASL